jgi:hypothetical protein
MTKCEKGRPAHDVAYWHSAEVSFWPLCLLFAESRHSLNISRVGCSIASKADVNEKQQTSASFNYVKRDSSINQSESTKDSRRLGVYLNWVIRAAALFYKTSFAGFSEAPSFLPSNAAAPHSLALAGPRSALITSSSARLAYLM